MPIVILKDMEIAIVGIGYVGLVTAAVFADRGNKVWGIDIDKKKITTLKSGQLPFYEPGLKDLVKKNLKQKRLFFTTKYQEAIPQTQIIFICVGTPAKANGDYDLSFIFSAVKQLAQHLKRPSVICIKSTVPPSATEEIKEILKKATNIPFDLASCPEFLREGSAIYDTLYPSRIVIGAESKKAKEWLLKLHAPIRAPRLICDLKSAQMIKYAANAFLATKISFINSIARLCDVVGADIKKVSEGLGLDPRIGKEFLNAGLGYGGSCFPKDTWALVSFAKRLGYDFKFLKEVDNVNQTQIDYFVEKIINNCQKTVKNKVLTILGLAFKPNTDDVRESRAIKIMQKLQKKGAKLNACDPVANENAKRLIKGVNFFVDPYKALKASDCLILVTEWPEFKNLDFKKVAKLMKRRVVVDARNIYDPVKLKRLGFIYEGVGRKNFFC